MAQPSAPLSMPLLAVHQRHFGPRLGTSLRERRREASVCRQLKPGDHVEVLVDKFSRVSIWYSGRNRILLRQQLDECNEMLEVLKEFKRELSHSSQVHALCLLHRLGQNCASVGGFTKDLVLLFAKEVDELFDAPSLPEVEVFSDNMRPLRKQVFPFTGASLRLSLWGSLQRFPTYQRDQVSDVQREMTNNPDMQEQCRNYVISELDRITREAPGQVLEWFAKGCKKPCLTNDLRWLDSEWSARIYQLCKHDLVFQWTSMGIAAKFMIDEGVIPREAFSCAKLDLVIKFEKLECKVTPRFIGHLAAIRSELESKLATVEAVERRLMAGIMTGLLAVGPLLLKYSLQTLEGLLDHNATATSNFTATSNASANLVTWV